MSNLSVAKEISNTLGNKCLFMIGAKNLAGDEKSLHFKVGRNSKGVTHVVITLNSLDLYDMEFLSCRGTSRKVKAEANGVYGDMLNPMIEEHTGMYTSL